MDLRVFLKLDGSGFKQGLAGALNSVEHFTNKADKQLMSRFGQMFTAGAIAYAGKEIMRLAASYQHLSIQTGLTTDKVQDLAFAASMSDLPAESAARAYSKLSQSIIQARNGSPEAIKSFRELGISVGEISALGADEIIRRISENMGDLSDETERSAAFMTIFGRSGNDVKVLLKELPENLAKAKDQIKLTPEETKVLDDAGDHYTAFFRNLWAGGGKAAAVVERLHNGLGDLVDTAFDYAKVASFLWTDATPSELIEEANQKRRGRGLRYDASWGSKYASMEFPTGVPANKPPPEFEVTTKVDLLADERRAAEVRERISDEIFKRELETLTTEEKRVKLNERINQLKRQAIEERFQGNETKAAEAELEIEQTLTELQRLSKTKPIDPVMATQKPSDSLLAVGNFLGSSGAAIESVGKETNKILREHTDYLRTLANNSTKPGMDLGIPA